jgi:hypothetical protein
MAARLKIQSRELVVAAVKLDPAFTGSVRPRLIRPLRPARFMRDALLAALFFVQTMFS